MFFNDCFDQLARFGENKDRVKIKPVILTEHVDYSRTNKNCNLLGMEVMETGEIIDVVHK